MKLKTLVFSALAACAMVGVSAVVTVPFQAPAAAQSSSAKAIVDKAIQDGVIGETAGGYLAAVNGASVSSEVRNAMNEVNIGRKTLFTRLAREQNVQVEVVAALTGEKQIAKAAPGTKVLTKENRWVTVQ